MRQSRTYFSNLVHSMDLISSIEQRLKAPQTVFGNGLVSIVEQPAVDGFLWDLTL